MSQTNAFEIMFVIAVIIATVQSIRLARVSAQSDMAHEAGMDMIVTLEEYREDLSQARSELSSAESLRDDYKSRLESLLGSGAQMKALTLDELKRKYPDAPILKVNLAKPKAVRSALTP